MEVLTDQKRRQLWSWQQSCLVWAVDNFIKEEKGNPLEFRNHRFLMDIFDDWSPIQVVRKSSQIGFSTMNIIKSFWGAFYKGYNVIYTLPTFADVGQFVPSKVNSLITNNVIFQEMTRDKDTTFQKKVGKGFIYYRGTSSGRMEGEKSQSGVGIMLTSDLNVHDECDRSEQPMLEQYESRLEASTYGGKWYFSNPTVPGTLSQKVWDNSDQKHWFIKCEHCNHWQYLDFWKNIKEGMYVCEKCMGEVSDKTRMNGRWVKKDRTKDISGYWISHLMCSWISAAKIEEEYENKTRQYFYNFVLGLPYVGSDVVVNKDILLKNIDLKEPNFKEHCCLGVDQGLKKWWVLGNKQGIFRVGSTEKWEDIEELIKTYDVELAVFDALPDLTEPRKLRQKYPGKVWLNYYKKDIKRADFIKWDYTTHTVYSDRTKLIQWMIDEFVGGRIKFQMEPRDLEQYIRHWTSLYKEIIKDSMGIDRDVWQTTGEDHFVHATNYWKIALEKTEGNTEIKEYSGGEKKPYDGIAPEIAKIAFDNESQII